MFFLLPWSFAHQMKVIGMLKKFGAAGAGEARLEYQDGDFRVLTPGTYVLCAVTGQKILLDELKYWSVDRQEAYATPEAVLQRLHPELARPAG